MTQIKYNKIPRKLKKSEKKLIILNAPCWKTKECKIKEYTRNVRGRFGFHKVTAYTLGY